MMSSAVIVVQAGKKSGTIVTAQHAKELKRPLGVVLPKEGLGIGKEGSQEILDGGASALRNSDDLNALLARSRKLWDDQFATDLSQQTSLDTVRSSYRSARKVLPRKMKFTVSAPFCRSSLST